MSTNRRRIEARPMRNRLIFLCDCFARFAEALRTLQTIMNPHRRAKYRHEPLIGEKGFAVLKTGCSATNHGVGLIAWAGVIDTNPRRLARVENVERNGEFEKGNKL